MINQELVNKYQTALDIANSNDKLRRYTQLIRETLYKLLQPNYIATIDEVVWAECFIRRGEKIDESEDDFDMTILKEFTKNDWFGYSGAQKFEDGTEPLIATKEFEQVSITVIVDNQCIEVSILDFESDVTQIWSTCKDGYKRFKTVVAEEICRVLDSVSDGLILKETLLTQLGMNFEDI